MSTTLSLRVDEETRERLEALAKRRRRSKSFLAAEAIASYVEAERWQLDEIAAGLDDIKRGRTVGHEAVAFLGVSVLFLPSEHFSKLKFPALEQSYPTDIP